MPAETSKATPEPTLRRLPTYLRCIKELQAAGRVFASCTDIGAALKLDPTQVRKDLEFTGLPGKPKVGYALAELIPAIERFLGLNNVQEAFLVGAGSMGAALLGYTKFKDFGLNIIAAFDSDPAKHNTTIHDKPVLPLEKLPDLCRRMHVLIGVITVPAPFAQTVADLMIAGGIRAIWNFAPVRLQTPDAIIVHNEDLYCSLASLSQKLARALQSERALNAGDMSPTVDPRPAP